MSRILVIDDDVNLLQMVRLMLERVGHQVDTSSKGEEGIDMAAKLGPDLAIIDVMMPGLSGYDVVRRIREDARTAKIPIIILTARSQPMDKQMALEAGANAFLSKPVTSKELTDRVDAVMKAGVNYRVHTGLLTELVPETSQAPRPPANEIPDSARAPEPVITPPQPETATSPNATRPLEAPPVEPGVPAGTAAPRAESRPAGRVPIGADDLTPPPSIPATGPLPIIAIASLRGGTGSTTVAANLAFLLASHKRRVCLVDLSTSSGHLPLHLHLTPSTHWGQLLKEGDKPDPQVLNGLLIQHPRSGIGMLAAPPVPTFQTLSTPAVQHMLSDLSGQFNHIIVDIPQFDPATQGALSMASAVVVVLTDDPPSIQTTGQFIAALNSINVDPAKIRLVLNHVRPTNDVPAETIQKALKRPLTAELPFDVNQLNAIRRGVPLVIGQPDSPFAKSIQQLARAMTMSMRA